MTNRYRKQGLGLVSSEGYIDWTSAPSLITEKLGSRMVNVSNQFKEISDESHPNFRKRIARGELIIGNLKARTYDLSSGGGSVRGENVATSEHGDGWTVVSDSVTQYCAAQFGCEFDLNYRPPLNVSEDDAILKAMAGVGRSGYTFLEDVLEARETLQQIRHPVANLTDILRDFQKRKAAKGLASAWAYYRFGISPILRSIHDATELYNSNRKTLSVGNRLRSTAVVYDETHGTKQSIPSPGEFIYVLNYSLQRRYRVGIYYKVKTPVTGLLFETGTQFKDLPAGFWAVVPYSFMVDRVVNLSNFVNAVTAFSDPNIIVEGGYITETETLVNSLQLIDIIPPNTDWTYQVSGDLVSLTDKNVTRRPFLPSLTTVPLPSVEIMGLVDSATKVADLLALAKQRLK